jgi:hypothetical protein
VRWHGNYRVGSVSAAKPAAVLLLQLSNVLLSMHTDNRLHWQRCCQAVVHAGVSVMHTSICTAISYATIKGVQHVIIV